MRAVALYAGDGLVQPSRRGRRGEHIACARRMALIGTALFLAGFRDAAQTIEFFETTFGALLQQLAPRCRRERPVFS